MYDKIHYKLKKKKNFKHKKKKKKSIFLVTKRKSQEAKRLPANKQHLRPVGNPWSGHSGIQSQPLLHLLCDLVLSTEDLTVPFPL